MRFAIIPWIWVPIVIAGALIVNRPIARKLDEERWKDTVDRLAAELAAPEYAVLCDSGLMVDIGRIRKKCFEERGVERFLPYGNVARLAKTGSTEMIATLPDGTRTDTLPTEQIAQFEHSYEYYWLQHVAEVCDTLATEFELNTGAGAYFKEHPEAFDDRILPMLPRLLQHEDLWQPRYQACRALLAAGHPLEEVVATLTECLREPRVTVGLSDDGEWAIEPRYSERALAAARLVRQYSLSVPVDVGAILASEEAAP